MSSFLDTLYSFYLEQWGWLAFALIAGVIFALVLIDNQRRQIRAIGWLVGLFVCLLLFVPALVYAVGPQEAKDALQGIRVLIFYLGVLGGLVPVMIAVGYWVTYRGYNPAADAAARAEAANQAAQSGQQQRRIWVVENSEDVTQLTQYASEFRKQENKPARPPRELVDAWLVDIDNPQRVYQLSIGTTTLGRHTKNDVTIADPAISREHALIEHQDGQFYLQDLGSRTGTLLNNVPIQKRELLNVGDEITLGDTRLRFVH